MKKDTLCELPIFEMLFHRDVEAKKINNPLKYAVMKLCVNNILLLEAMRILENIEIHERVDIPKSQMPQQKIIERAMESFEDLKEYKKTLLDQCKEIETTMKGSISQGHENLTIESEHMRVCQPIKELDDSMKQFTIS